MSVNDTSGVLYDLFSEFFHEDTELEHWATPETDLTVWY